MKRIPFFESIRSNSYWIAKFDIPVYVGNTDNNTPYLLDLAKLPHLLINGHGSIYLKDYVNLILSGMLSFSSFDSLRIILVDPQKSLFLVNSMIRPNLSKKSGFYPNHMLNAIFWLKEEMDKRIVLFKESNSRNIKAFNRKCPSEEALPYLALVITDMEEIINTTNNQIEIPLASIIAVSRAMGIHVIRCYKNKNPRGFLDMSPLVEIDLVSRKYKQNKPCGITDEDNTCSAFSSKDYKKFKRLHIPSMDSSESKDFLKYYHVHTGF